MMDIRIIRTQADYQHALAAAHALMDAEPGTEEAARLEVLATLIEAYEAKHHHIDAPDPIEAILFMLDQKGLSPEDLEPVLGGRQAVSDVLSRHQALTLPMIRALVPMLSLPADVLIREYPVSDAA